MNIFLEDTARDDASARRIDGALERLIADVGRDGPERLFLTGISHIKVNALALMRRDLATLTPASLALVVAVLFFSFRTRRGVVLPLLCVVVGVVWTMGIMGWMGEPISLGTLVLPSLLVVIGSSYATHVVARYYLELETPTVPGQPVYGALQQAGLPVFVSGVTTVIGFSALMLNPIQAVRSLGLYAVVGIALLFVLAMTLVPAMIELLPERRYRRDSGVGRGESGRLGAILAALARFDIVWRRAIFVIAAVLVAGSLLAIPRIEADTNFLSYFPASAPVRVAHQTINERVAGALPFYVVVGDRHARLDGRRKKRCGGCATSQRFIDRIPGVTRSVSITDYLDLFDKGLRSSGDIVLDDEGRPVAPVGR